MCGLARTGRDALGSDARSMAAAMPTGPDDEGVYVDASRSLALRDRFGDLLPFYTHSVARGSHISASEL